MKQKLQQKKLFLSLNTDIVSIECHPNINDFQTFG